MLYVAWADGVLTDAELQTLRQTARAYEWLSDAERETLLGWLDPSRPPSASDLQDLLRQIREAADGSTAERIGLVELGLSIARDELETTREAFQGSPTLAALEAIEAAMGVCSVEAARAVVGAEFEAAPATPKIAREIDGLAGFLGTPYRDVRDRVLALLQQPGFEHAYEVDKEAQREIVMGWSQRLADAGIGALTYPGVTKGDGDLGEFIAAMETVALFDLSLTIKLGVQFGLFGGSIYFLGTDLQREEYLHDVASLALPGCFAMTERGHGSNVQGLETTATWQPATDSFEVHTPTPGAAKEFIGNAATHGRLATVYAQLYVGDQHHGVHALLVPIRDENGAAIPGVRIEDCGHKMGLNGVDNGMIYFDRVRVPRTALLGRFGRVTEDGEYVSDIPSATRRFFTMIGTLVAGRISVALAGVSATKVALTSAIKYADSRRQFGPGDGRAETRLLDYRYHQLRLMPPLARTFAVHFALRECTHRYLADMAAEDKRDIEARAAALKVLSTWNTTKTIQTCRECCGGAGYLSVNRFTDLKADTDVFATFEGDNVVLLQLVARNLLTQFRRQFADDRVFSLLKYVARQATSALIERNPLVTYETSDEHLLDPAFQLRAFHHRESDLVGSLARRLKRRIIDQKMDAFDAFNECQPHVISLAWAYAERLAMEGIHGAVEAAPESLRPSLEQLRNVYALDALQSDIGWFLENDWVEPRKAKAIRKLLHRLCLDLSQSAPAIVDGLGIPDPWLAQIARSC
jgi:acyl-CoA oxidase